MKIAEILTGNIPAGVHRLAALSNKTVATKKAQTAIATIPHGLARCHSLYTQTNTVVLADDAIRLGLKVASFGCCRVSMQAIE